MKRFKQFLTEKPMMSRDEAMRVLGLHQGYTKDDLKTAYRAASLKAHPDRGGSNEAMARVNNANDVLAGSGGDKTVAQQKYDRDAADEKAAAYAKLAQETTNRHIKLDAFTQHFAKVFGEPFTGTGMWHPYGRHSGHYTWWTGQWQNASKSIVVTLSLTVLFDDFYSKPLLANAEHGLKMSILTEILVNRKKIKLGQRDYRMETENAVLSDPSKLFPADKLKKQVAKSEGRKMSKRDILLTFQRELGARLSDEWAYIPVGEWMIAMWRSTMMGTGSWGVNGIYPAKGHRRAATIPHVFFFMEDDASINGLVDFFRTLQKHPPTSADDLAAKVDKYGMDYRHAREAQR